MAKCNFQGNIIHDKLVDDNNTKIICFDSFGASVMKYKYGVVDAEIELLSIPEMKSFKQLEYLIYPIDNGCINFLDKWHKLYDIDEDNHSAKCKNNGSINKITIFNTKKEARRYLYLNISIELYDLIKKIKKKY